MRECFSKGFLGEEFLVSWFRRSLCCPWIDLWSKMCPEICCGVQVSAQVFLCASIWKDQGLAGISTLHECVVPSFSACVIISGEIGIIQCKKGLVLCMCHDFRTRWESSNMQKGLVPSAWHGIGSRKYLETRWSVLWLIRKEKARFWCSDMMSSGCGCANRQRFSKRCCSAKIRSVARACCYLLVSQLLNSVSKQGLVIVFCRFLNKEVFLGSEM